MKKLFLMLLMGCLVMSSAFAALELTTLEYKVYPPDDANLLIGLKNTGSTTETGIIELAHYPEANTFSWVFQEQACDPEFPYNVYREYSINAGSSATFTITAHDIPDGTYKAVVTHATSCCTDGVNSYSCEAKTPLGFEHVLERNVVIGDPTANQDDVCDTDYQAMQYLKSQNVLNCKVASCVDASGSSSTALCEEYGSCNTGATQSQVCADGTTLNVRYCNNAEWQDTGASCPDEPLPDEPILGKDDAILWGGVAILAAFGLWMIFRRK